MFKTRLDHRVSVVETYVSVIYEFYRTAINKNINIEQEEWILQLPVCKVADTRLANVLYNQDVRTVKDLLEIVSGRGWKSLLRIEGVGKTSYYHLLSKLQMIGVVDESLDRILAGHSVGRFEKR